MRREGKEYRNIEIFFFCTEKFILLGCPHFSLYMDRGGAGEARGKRGGDLGRPFCLWNISPCSEQGAFSLSFSYRLWPQD